MSAHFNRILDIVKLLHEDWYTAREISELLKADKQTVRHHINGLVARGLVHVVDKARPEGNVGQTANVWGWVDKA